MSLPLLVNSICPSRVHCETCRAREGGRAWRVSVGRFKQLPAAGPDFDCPNGLPWHDGPAPGVGPVTRPPEPIPADFDVERERARMRQGGCCGAPASPRR